MRVGRVRDSFRALSANLCFGFTGCGKTRAVGGPGIYPRHKANRINVGF